jgi:hypothetical protein
MKNLSTNAAALKSNKQFVKVYFEILKSRKFNLNQVMIIHYILGWQEGGKECITSNAKIANELGINIEVLKREIKKLNKLSFFISKKISKPNEFGGWINSKIMVIDEDGLFEYINSTSTEENQIDLSINPPNSAQPPLTNIKDATIALDAIADARIEDNYKNDITPQPNKNNENMGKLQILESDYLTEEEQKILDAGPPEITSEDKIEDWVLYSEIFQKKLVLDKKLKDIERNEAYEKNMKKIREEMRNKNIENNEDDSWDDKINFD